jgi:hypothetical protein
MRKIDYDAHDRNTGSTETQIAVDEALEKKYGNLRHAYEEGFAASHGVRGETAETNGRAPHPDMADDSHPDRVPDSIEEENPGLKGS